MRAWRIGSGSSPTNDRKPSRLRRALERSRDRRRSDWAIEHDGVDARVARGTRREQRRPDVRVVAGAHVREVDDQDVDLRELLASSARDPRASCRRGSRLGAPASRRPRSRVDRLLGLRVGVEPVLRRENERGVAPSSSSTVSVVRPRRSTAAACVSTPTRASRSAAASEPVAARSSPGQRESRAERPSSCGGSLRGNPPKAREIGCVAHGGRQISIFFTVRRVLVVDDEENLRLVLRTLLQRHGYEVESGRERRGRARARRLVRARRRAHRRAHAEDGRPRSARDAARPRATTRP